MNISNQEYGELAKKLSPPSAMYKTIPLAFVIGGGICTLGELLLNVYQMLGLDMEKSGMLTSMTLIFLSALFTGLKLYDGNEPHAERGKYR